MLQDGHARFHVTYSEAPSAELDTLFGAWVLRSARAVASYYGQFPFDDVSVEVTLLSGEGVSGARVFGGERPTIRLRLGRRTGAKTFQRDWRMTHEMVHLAFPDLERRHHWIEEGLATYVEPIARARIGWIDEVDVYREWTSDMQQGQPRHGEHGLDGTTSWARTYWGGALFCLRADVEIRVRTKNRRGLRDALRAILRAGGRIDAHWSLARALEIGDEAVGVPVLQELYADMAVRPVVVDLDLLWERLGVGPPGGGSAGEEARLLRRSIIFD